MSQPPTDDPLKLWLMNEGPGEQASTPVSAGHLRLDAVSLASSNLTFNRLSFVWNYTGRPATCDDSTQILHVPL